jgi:hypothetical protein
MLAGLIAGMLLVGPQGIAFAQDDKPRDKPVDIAAITQPSPVVAAMPYQSQTDYEQDPFEPTKLRRTSMQVRRVLLVHQDGTMAIRDATP